MWLPLFKGSGDSSVREQSYTYKSFLENESFVTPTICKMIFLQIRDRA